MMLRYNAENFSREKHGKDIKRTGRSTVDRKFLTGSYNRVILQTQDIRMQHCEPTMNLKLWRKTDMFDFFKFFWKREKEKGMDFSSRVPKAAKFLSISSYDNLIIIIRSHLVENKSWALDVSGQAVP